MPQALSPTSGSPNVAPAPPSTPVHTTESPLSGSFHENDDIRTLGRNTSDPCPGPSRISTFSYEVSEADQSPTPLPKSITKKKKKKAGPAPLLRRLQPMLVLENSGSVARDHLASERTFLAYVRTSLAIASTGVALVQLFTISVNTTDASIEPASFAPASRKLQSFARPLGATTVVFAVIILVIGMTRYFTVQSALTKGMFPVARVVMTAITAFLGVLIAIVFGVLVAERTAIHGAD